MVRPERADPRGGAPLPLRDTELFADVRRFAAVGPRFCGSDGEVLARALVAEGMAAAGLRNVRYEPVAVRGYAPRAAACVVDGGETLPCTGLQYTGIGEARGYAVDLGDGSEAAIAAATSGGADALRGKVAIVRGLPFRVAARLTPYGIAALVHIGETAGGYVAHFTASFWPPSLDAPLAPFPGVSVQAQAGARLLAAVAEGPVELTVTHDAAYRRVTTANVVGELPGSDPDADVLVLGAHSDTQFGSPGASDNATGLAALLGIAAAWRNVAPRRTTLFVAFAAEELGAWGATAFLAARAGASHARRAPAAAGAGAGIRAMVNLDALGPPVKATRMLVTTPGLSALARTAAAATGWEVEQEVDARDFLYTDNAPFAAAGIETCLLWRLGPPHPYYHSAADTPAHVDPIRLGEDARASASVAWRLAHEPA